MATALALTLVSGPAQATSTPTPTSTAEADAARAAAEVPVLGRTTITGGAAIITGDEEIQGVQATVLVHGLRRVPGGTVLYYSAGIPAGSGPASWGNFKRNHLDRIKGSSSFSNIRLLDFDGRKAYLPLYLPKGGDERVDRLLVSPYRAWPPESTGGTFYTFYLVMAELPQSLSAIDIQLGNGDIVPDVPIEDGVLEPAVVQDDENPTIRLGEGWPAIDLADVSAAAATQAESVMSLHLETSDIEGTVTERSSAEDTSVDIASDVLFAVDSAELGPDADQALSKAAAQVNSSAAGGEIEIVGHTDSTGTAAHNEKLSKRRARAVAQALEPLITVPGVTYGISGKGAREPLEENSTAEGRRQNRRVSVVFAPKEQN
ncbi:OmpA family protein [Kineosporia babensis]|uniref:OmpA family protein n=1 Tax=Kineosporia babensis TaxID=499548 RepID=A0A9X1N9Q6_9ACTN|nr:OmpA family protein [Kineosporia babensis]